MQSVFLFTGIVLFFIVALILSNYVQRKKGNNKQREATPSVLAGGGCCGAHETCIRTGVKSAVAGTPDYFDDEELDRHAYRDPDGYTEEETEEFRNIFYSLLDEEKSHWLRSLHARNISLPTPLKDEVCRVIDEVNAGKQHA